MSRELREIERKIREAAKKQKELEMQEKEQIKISSSQGALKVKLKIEEDLQKKEVDYGRLFISVFAIIAAAFVVFTIWQICDVLSPKANHWQKAQISDKDISDLKMFLSECLGRIKSKKSIDELIYTSVPQTWKNQIKDNFLKTQNGKWVVRDLVLDEQKIGADPFFIATIAEANEYFRIIVVKSNSQFFIYKCSKIFGETNENE